MDQRLFVWRLSRSTSTKSTESTESTKSTKSSSQLCPPSVMSLDQHARLSAAHLSDHRHAVAVRHVLPLPAWNVILTVSASREVYAWALPHGGFLGSYPKHQRAITSLCNAPEVR